MRLYDSRLAPNPRRTRIFLAEKGVTIPTEQVDMVAMQHKTPEYTAINPLQRMPALVLDDGTIITESIAICRYFGIQQPDPPLSGGRPPPFQRPPRPAAISRPTIPTHRCAGSVRRTPPLSRCGTGAQRSI